MSTVLTSSYMRGGGTTDCFTHLTSSSSAAASARPRKTSLVPQLASEDIPPSVNAFQVTKFLGRGGFGEVHVGEEEGDRKVALKFIRKADINTLVAAERTLREIQCLLALDNKHIIKLHGTHDIPNFLVLEFELAEGGDLHQYLASRGTTAKEIRLPEDDARKVFHQIVHAVSYAQMRSIVHRDLKLENVLLAKADSLDVVLLADFGLAQCFRPGQMLKIEEQCGTLSVLAPELFVTDEVDAPAIDVWSMGVILYTMLCGR